MISAKTLTRCPAVGVAAAAVSRLVGDRAGLMRRICSWVQVEWDKEAVEERVAVAAVVVKEAVVGAAREEWVAAGWVVRVPVALPAHAFAPAADIASHISEACHA